MSKATEHLAGDSSAIQRECITSHSQDQPMDVSYTQKKASSVRRKISAIPMFRHQQQTKTATGLPMTTQTDHSMGARSSGLVRRQKINACSFCEETLNTVKIEFFIRGTIVIVIDQHSVE